jgi:riboflavin kinase/FMN adenylyltransferase
VASITVIGLDEVQRRPRKVAIGEFDGVHRGHRALLHDIDTVLTFDPHPLAVVAPERAPRLLTRLDVRAEILAELGVREMVVVPFTPAFAAKRANVFIDEDLIGRLGAETICVGRNFRFGRGAKADASVFSEHRALEARIVELVTDAGEPVSSTRIRALLDAGDVEGAGALLERPFELPAALSPSGREGPREVVMTDPALLCPAAGRYACQVMTGSGTWQDAEVAVPARTREAPVPAGDETRVRFLRRTREPAAENMLRHPVGGPL